MNTDEIIKDWFNSIKKNLPYGSEIIQIYHLNNGDGAIITYTYGKYTGYGVHREHFKDEKRLGRLEIKYSDVIKMNRENKLNELGL